MAVPISNVTRRQVYAPSGAGGAGPYAFTFEILANTDIAVFKDDTLLTLTTHYTVVINANGTGSVTITAAGLALTPTSPTQYAIVGNRTIARTSDFTTGGDFFANTLNDELDQQTIFAQQNAEGVARSLAAPQTDPISINMTLPRASLRANKALGFDASGNPVISDTLGTNRGNWAAGVLYYVRDIVKDTTNNNIWQVITQHTSSGSQPINTNADSAKWTLLVDAASATTSATNAAASASAASTSASNASTSASNASTSASNASTSASNASSSASAASTSASNAAASYDSFDDRYLGPKATAPTLDNDGNALLTGALYWDTVANTMEVWSGSAWVDVNASASNTRTAITATASQTVLSVATYTPGTNTMVVYVNGVKLNASEYTETNANTVTLTTGLALNDEVEVFSYQVNAIGSLGASSVTFTQAGTGATARNVQTKLQEYVSVKDFGAIGNGATDDTAAINKAIDAAYANGGGVVTFEPKTYAILTTVKVRSNVTLDLCGATLQRIGTNKTFNIVQNYTYNPGTAIDTNISIINGTIAGNVTNDVATQDHLAVGGNIFLYGVSIFRIENIRLLAANSNGFGWRECSNGFVSHVTGGTFGANLFAPTSGLNNYVSNCDFAYAGATGASPGVCVDIEPNGVTEVVEMYFSNCRINDLVLVDFWQSSGGSFIIKAQFDNCTFVGGSPYTIKITAANSVNATNIIFGDTCRVGVLSSAASAIQIGNVNGVVCNAQLANDSGSVGTTRGFEITAAVSDLTFKGSTTAGDTAFGNDIDASAFAVSNSTFTGVKFGTVYLRGSSNTFQACSIASLTIANSASTGNVFPISTQIDSAITFVSGALQSNQVINKTKFDINLDNANLVIGTAGKGIDFSADSHATNMTSELFDDYEEGTWTAVLRGASTAGTYEFVNNTCQYTKVGRLVTLTAFLRLAGTITGGGVGYAQITGLPFEKLNNSWAVGAVSFTGVVFAGVPNVAPITSGNTSTLYFPQLVTAGGSEVDISGFGTGDYLNFTITYITA